MPMRRAQWVAAAALLSVIGCQDEGTLGARGPLPAFVFADQPLSAPADSVSDIKIELDLVGVSPLVATTATFTTTLGTFEGTSRVTTISVPVSSSRRAEALLRAPTTAGTALVTATVGGYSKTTTAQFTVNCPTTILVGLSKPSAVSGDSVLVTATLLGKTGIASNGTVVSFSASLGSFATAVATSGATGMVTAFYSAATLPPLQSSAVVTLTAHVDSVGSCPADTGSANLAVTAPVVVPPPAIASITPSPLAVGTNTITIFGSGLSPQAMAVVTDSNGTSVISTSNTVAAGGTSLTATVIFHGAGTYTITVSNPDGQISNKLVVKVP